MMFPAGTAATYLESAFAKTGAPPRIAIFARHVLYPGTHLGGISPLAFDIVNWGRQQPTERQVPSRVPRLFGTRAARSVAYTVEESVSSRATFAPTRGPLRVGRRASENTHSCIAFRLWSNIEPRPYKVERRALIARFLRTRPPAARPRGSNRIFDRSRRRAPDPESPTQSLPAPGKLVPDNRMCTRNRSAQ